MLFVEAAITVTEEKKKHAVIDCMVYRLCYADLDPHACTKNHSVEIRNCPEIQSGSLESVDCSLHDSVQ